MLKVCWFAELCALCSAGRMSSVCERRAYQSEEPDPGQGVNLQWPSSSMGHHQCHQDTLPQHRHTVWKKHHFKVLNESLRVHLYSSTSVRWGCEKLWKEANFCSIMSLLAQHPVHFSTQKVQKLNVEWWNSLCTLNEFLIDDVEELTH